MHPFAPKKPTSNSGHPGDEELAAYVDGMLGEEEAARVTEHLGACADCYRVCSETRRFLLEEGEEEEPAAAPAGEEAAVVPFPSGRKAKAPWWLAAAAAVLVVGLGAGLFMLVGPAPEMTTAELVEPLEGEPAFGRDLWTPRDRSGSSEGMGDPDEPLFNPRISFGIGVQLVDLQVGLEGNDPEVADAVLPLLLGLLEKEYLIDPQLINYFTELRVSLSEGKPPEGFTDEAFRKSEELREFLGSEPYLELGRFVEAGRLAAIVGEPSFFERWSTRRILRHLLKQQEKGELTLDPEALRSLEAISERLGGGDLQAADYEMLKEDFEEILRRNYPS